MGRTEGSKGRAGRELGEGREGERGIEMARVSI